MTPLEMLLPAVGAKDDPNSGGRQMPSHWGHKALNIVSQSSPTGTQCLQAVGCAEAGLLYEQRHGHRRTASRRFQQRRGRLRLARRRHDERGRVLGVAQHRLHRASCRSLFLVEDNGYAISVPVEVQTPGGDISRLVASFPGLQRAERRRHRLRSRATARCARPSRTCARAQGPGARPRQGHPALLALALGRRAAVQDAGGARGRGAARSDRAARARSCKARGLATDDDLDGDRAGRRPRGRTTRPTRRAQGAEARRRTRRRSTSTRPTSIRRRPRSTTPAAPEGKPDTMVAAINRTLKDEMARNPRIVVFGEDVADCSREAALERGAGQGRRLQGHARPAAGVRQRRACSTRRSPRPTSSAARSAWRRAGIKPVVEIQFFDYIWPAMMQMRDEMSMMRYRSNNTFSCPMVIRVADRRLPARRRAVPQPVGREHLRALPRHPHRRSRRTPQDAAGLLRTAIRCDDPVLFLEHKHLYRQTYNKGEYPGADYMIPFGKAAVRREGTDVVVITWGALVQRSLLAAQQAEKDGISVDGHRPADDHAVRLGRHRRGRQEDQPRDHRARGPADVRLRRRDRRAHRRRAVRAPRRAGPARRPRSTRRSPTAPTSRK